MADDTRLAEACLLLNYSHQSYKEQMMITAAAKQQSQQTIGQSNEKQLETSLLDNNGRPQINDKTNSSTKLITPPPEHDYVVESHDEVQIFSAAQCLESPPGSEVTLSSNPTDHQGPKLDDSSAYQYHHNNVETNKMLTTQQGINYCESNIEPINNLLAAVNCALPGLRSRPTILLRNSITQVHPSESLSGTPTNQISDHDYCHLEHDINRTQKAYEPSCKDESYSQCGPNTLDATINYSCGGYKRKQELSSPFEFPFANSERPLKLVAVHLGAGNSYHDEESLNLAKRICEQVMLQTSAQLLLSNSKKRRKNTSNLHRQNAENQSQSDINSDKITAELAVVHLVKLMEDHQSLNCGYGSNLNIKGQVECDASLMSDETQMWAGIGAVSGCRNPILLAKSLYDHRTVPRPLNLIQPNLLVSSGAKQWMREKCPYLSVMDSKMVSSKSFSTYQKLKSKYDSAVKFTVPESNFVEKSELDRRKIRYKHKKTSIEDAHEAGLMDQYQKHSAVRMNDSANNSSSTNLDHGFYCVNKPVVEATLGSPSTTFSRVIAKPEPFNSEAGYTLIEDEEMKDSPNQLTGNHISNIEKEIMQANYRLDTVGAIAVDSNNNFASAISSGGILLKHKGRVGQAAVPGAGCWSEDSVAVTTTGVGEYLTLSMFAKKFNDKMQTLRLLYDLGHVEKKPDLSDIINNGIEECFEELFNSPALAHVNPKECLAGMLAVSTLNSKNSPDRVDTKDLYLSYAHNTNSMCVGHMTCDDIVGHSVMSRREMVPETIGDEGRNFEPLVKTIKFSLNTSTR